MDRASLCDFINRQRYGVISSLGDDGTPQSALIGLACTPALEIVFDTLTSSRKYRNFLQRPSCSLVVGWSGEQTLQLEGAVEIPQGENLIRLQDAYFAQWAEGRERAGRPGLAYLVVHPSWVRFSDFAQAPPLIEEFATADFTIDPAVLKATDAMLPRPGTDAR